MYDVIIAGAGPVGLFLACELRLAKLSVLVLEQLPDPHSPLKRMPFGMRGLWGPSLEAFYRRGLLDKLEPQFGGPVAKGASKTSGPAGHFAGLQFDRSNIDTARWPYRLPSPADAQMMSTMEELERVLSTHALAQGVEIRRGVGVETLAVTADQVTINGSLTAPWVVGCDGGRSTVRKLAGFDFVGTEPEFTGYSLDLELAEPDLLPIGRHHTPTGSWTQWNQGAFAISDFDGGEGHRKPVTIENVQAMLRRITGTHVTVAKIKVSSTWTDRAKQTTSYRNGRVLLAGDAAHIHSPLGGQGVNLGLGDAMNLGWKLAATIRGDAAEGLLDTYTAERHPIGARILEWSRAQVAAMRPDPGTRALQGVLRDVIDTPDGATYFAARVWGVTHRYDLGDSHPLVGRSCPDFELVDGTRLGTLLHDGTGVLLDFEGVRAPVAGFKHVTSDVKDRLGLRSVLVRPDGFVAAVS